MVAELAKSEAERKQAVETLRETRDYLENLINYASAPIIVWDPNTRIERFNRAFEHLTGYAALEVIGQELPILFPEGSRDESLSSIARTLSGERWESVEIPILRKDGETRLALWNSANIYAADGSTLLATIAQGTNITERNQNEEKIRHLNLVLRAIRSVNQLILREKDRDALLKSACDNLTETRGYYNAWIAVLDESGELVTTGEAGLGELFLPIVERLQRGELTHCAARALAQSDVVVTEDPPSACADYPLAASYAGRAAMTIRLEHGGRVFGLTSVSIPAHLAAEEEEVSLFREIANDIAFALHNIELEEERKRTQEALQRLMTFNESIVQNAAEGIVVIDAEGYIAFTNPFADALLGYDAEGLVGQQWTLIVPPDQQSVVVAADERRARGESDRYELDLVREDGTTIHVLVSGSTRFEEGRFDGTLAVFTDITELKRAEGEIRRRIEELAALNAVATSVTSTLNLEQVVQIIEERVQTLLGERYPPIFALFDEADEAFEAILTSAGAKLLEKAGKLPGVRLEELSVPLASMNPDARGALLAGKPYVTSDASDLVGSSISRKVVQAGQKALGIKCILNLPLWAKGRLVGALVLLSQREEVSEAQIELLASIGRHAAIAIDNATLYQAAGHEIAERQRAEGALRRSHQELQTTLGQTVAALAAAVEVRDPYTAGHQHRTADLAVATAEEMGLPEEQIRGIQMAGSVHDIGKIQIPAEILSKPTRLTEIEWALIKVHPQAGYDILREIDFPWPVARTVLEHHERMDGSGYPQGLSGEDICVEARILAVADVVEAMASHRPYRPAHAIQEALEELQENRGILYDAAAVDACVAVIAAKKFQFCAE